MINDKTLTIIKIKDMMAIIKKGVDRDSSFRLHILEMFDLYEKRAVENATEDDLRRIEKLYIKETLDITYFPSQKKKLIALDKKSRIVPIDYIYGSKNT